MRVVLNSWVYSALSGQANIYFSAVLQLRDQRKCQDKPLRTFANHCLGLPVVIASTNIESEGQLLDLWHIVKDFVTNYFVPLIGFVAATVGLIVTFSPRVRHWLKPGPDRGQAKTAAAIVYRDNDILMVKRRGRGEPLTWYFPSGSVKGGEEPAVRALQEVREETGIECHCEKKLGERKHPDTGVYMYYFACSYISGKASNLDSRENSTVEWVPASEVEQRIRTDVYEPVRLFLRELANG
jgi:8-oxo-dGTP pyrophosphatase MutT (NUDIX family)